jgi:hypothetical protein
MRASSVLVVTILFIFVDGHSRASEVGQLTGRGEWQSLRAEGVRGTWSVVLTRSADVLDGSINITGSNVFRDAGVTGTIDAGNIVLGVTVQGSRQATFSGRMQGDQISGEWEAPGVVDGGVWYGMLEPTNEP